VVGLFVVAVLAGVILTAFQMTYDRDPRRSKTATVVKNIVNACKAYANDHGAFPAIAAAVDGTAANPYRSFGDVTEGHCKVSNSQIFNVLRAIDAGPNAGNALNKTKARYFEENKATDKKLPREGFTDGPDFPEAGRGRLMDPWGAEYCIVLDGDGDEAINVGAFYADLAAPEMTIRSAAVAFSMSKDGKRGGKGYEGMLKKPKSDDAPDDMVSWQ
jgi:type II secretory pathway pseudopilin PulG